MKSALKIWLGVVLLLFIFSLSGWVGLNLVGIWGGISVLFLLFTLVFMLFYYLHQYQIVSSNLFANLRLLLFSVALVFLIAEVLLRFFAPDLKSYGERTGSYTYNSPFHTYLRKCDSCDGSFFISRSLSTEEMSNPEFHYTHKYNSLGLRDREFSPKKDTNEFRIIGMGDSFTEGVGTSADSTWLKQLENILNSSNTGLHYTTMNGGAHGSDLFFSYDLLNRCLLKYKPNLIILHLNSTDVMDLVFRGGYDRYDSEGNFKGIKGPWWEFIFGGSYIARLIILNGLHYNWQLLTAESQQQKEAEILKEIEQKINEYGQLARQNNSNFILVIHPLEEELRYNRNMLSGLKVDSSVVKIDLMDVFRNRIHGSVQLRAQYYWPVDGHFKTAGYGLEAEEIYRKYFEPANKKQLITKPL